MEINTHNKAKVALFSAHILNCDKSFLTTYRSAQIVRQTF